MLLCDGPEPLRRARGVEYFFLRFACLLLVLSYYVLLLEG